MWRGVKNEKEEPIAGFIKTVNARLLPNPFATQMEQGSAQCVSSGELQAGVFCARDLGCQATDKKATCYFPTATVKTFAFCAVPDIHTCNEQC